MDKVVELKGTATKTSDLLHKIYGRFM